MGSQDGKRKKGYLESNGRVRHGPLKSTAVNFVGVEEGKAINFNSLEAQFAFCTTRLALQANDDGEDICFKDFLKPEYNDECKFGEGELDPVLVKNLEEMNVITMRPIQIATYQACFYQPPPEVHAHPDFIGISSTGSGKTVSFLVPAIQKCLSMVGRNEDPERTPKVLIFAHSIPLVVNIYQTAVKLAEGTPLIIKMITGGKAFLRDSFFDIGICTMGRYLAHNDPKKEDDDDGVRICLDELEYLIIDEADKLSESHTFRKIFNAIKEEEPDVITMLFSATYSTNIEAFVNKKNYYQFACGSINEVSSSIIQYFWQCNTKSDSKIYGGFCGKILVLPYDAGEIPHPFDLLYTFIKDTLFKKSKKKKVIIFVKKICLADMIAQRLKVYGFDAIAVHGNQPAYKREEYLQQFISGGIRILVGTNLLTRGTDIDVDYVINYDLPDDYVDYVHRCGRTGRNQKKGTAITFVDPNEPKDYNLMTLQSIASKLDDDKVSDFMLPYVQQAKAVLEAAHQQYQEMFSDDDYEKEIDYGY